MDGSQRHNGIVMFNLDDTYLKKDCTAFASVLLECKSTDPHDFGSKYIHTYNTPSYSWGLDINFKYTATGPEGGFTFSLKGNSVGSTWRLYATH